MWFELNCILPDKKNNFRYCSIDNIYTKRYRAFLQLLAIRNFFLRQ